MSWGAIAVGVISAYSASRAQSAAKKAMKPQQALQQAQLEQMQRLTPEFEAQLGEQNKYLDQYQEYLRKLASGSNSALMQAMGPQMEQQQQSTAAAQRGMMEVNPRGTGQQMAAQSGDALRQSQDQMVRAAQPMGMQALGQLSQQRLGNAMGGLNYTQGGMSGLNTQMQGLNQMQYGMGQGIGNSAMSALANVDWASVIGAMRNRPSTGALPTSGVGRLGGMMSAAPGVNTTGSPYWYTGGMKS